MGTPLILVFFVVLFAALLWFFSLFGLASRVGALAQKAWNKAFKE